MPGNLPRVLSSFVGRHEEVSRLAHDLSGSSLLTLVGAGGVGKTRLALATATAVVDKYAHGAWLVELARVTDPTRVVAAVAGALGIRDRPGSSPQEMLSFVLRNRQLLLVLDNCEHVVQNTAELVAMLRQECQQLSVLATSRARLGVQGESIWTVPPLNVVGPSATVDQVVSCDAVQLLVARIRASQPSFALTAETSPLAAQICRRVDGLPLAIELAAARANTMNLSEIAARLERPLGLLTVGPRVAPLRQQSLRATIDWSYDLLSPPVQTLLRRLAVFSGGFTVGSASQVCSDDDGCPAEPIGELLEHLASQSLLNVETADEGLRFEMLETIRQYALERLEQSGEVIRFRERHRDWCLALVDTVPPEAFDPGRTARLEVELDNVRTALHWTTQTHQLSAAAHLVLGLANSWHLRGSLAEGRAALSAVLDLASADQVSAELPHVGIWAATLAAEQGDYVAAENHLVRARTFARIASTEYAELFATSQLGWLALLRGDAQHARDVLEKTLVGAPADSPLARVIGSQLAMVYVELGDQSLAISLLQGICSQVSCEAGPLFGRVLKTRALLAEQRGEYLEAERHLDEAIALERAIGDQPGLIESLTLRGVVAAERGTRAVAIAVLSEALDLASLCGSNMRLAVLLEAVSSLVASAQSAGCVRLAAAAEQLRKSLGAAPLPTEQRRVGGALDDARRRLSRQLYADLWRDAQGVPLETSLSEARQVLQTAADACENRVGAPARTDALTEREREVARLVAHGLTNKQIADELIISRKTVEAHVGHVLNKLGLSRRVQIATWEMLQESAECGE